MGTPVTYFCPALDPPLGIYGAISTSSLPSFINIHHVVPISKGWLCVPRHIHVHELVHPPLTSPTFFVNKFKKKRPKGPHNVHLSTMCHLLWWNCQGGNLYSLFGPKNTNLVEDVKILLPVKFRWIPFNGFRGKVKICLSQSEARVTILFFWISPKKHKLCRGRWELAFCQVSLNSVQWFHRRSQKCLSQSEDRAAILFFWSAWKRQAW